MDESQTASIWGWRGATSEVSLRLKRILGTGERSDVQFIVGRHHGEERLFRAHSFMLSLGSDVFDTMFYGEIPQAKEKPIELPDILPQAFDIMLKFLYTNVIENLNMENALQTLYCGEKYGIPKLVDMCAEYAIKNVDKNTCLTTLEAAKDLDAENVAVRCLEIVDTYCRELLQTEAFTQIRLDTLKEIFIRDTLIAKEDEVYKAAERWAAEACRTSQFEPTAANYRRVLGEALYSVRFPLMDDGQLFNGPGATGLLLNEELLKICQFKHAVRKPDIPFSGISRTSNITFCDRQWLVLGDVNPMQPNAYVDANGHLHLRFSQHEGVWKRAEVRSAGALGFGRYEFHIEGLDKLDCNVDVALCSRAENESRVSIDFTQSPEDGARHQNRCMVRFSIRGPNATGPFPANLPRSDTTVVMETSTTHSYQWRPSYVWFYSQRGHQPSNINEVFHDWCCSTARSAIPQKPLPVFISLASRRGDVPSFGKEVEIIVHSFRFYPIG